MGMMIIIFVCNPCSSRFHNEIMMIMSMIMIVIVKRNMIVMVMVMVMVMMMMMMMRMMMMMMVMVMVVVMVRSRTRMMALYQPEISCPRGYQDRGASNPGPPGGGGVRLERFRVSDGPVPAYSLLKQEQLQLAEASFREKFHGMLSALVITTSYTDHLVLQGKCPGMSRHHPLLFDRSLPVTTFHCSPTWC